MKFDIFRASLKENVINVLQAPNVTVSLNISLAHFVFSCIFYTLLTLFRQALGNKWELYAENGIRRFWYLHLSQSQTPRLYSIS
jgi:hypothetical protein